MNDVLNAISKAIAYISKNPVILFIGAGFYLLSVIASNLPFPFSLLNLLLIFLVILFSFSIPSIVNTERKEITFSFVMSCLTKNEKRVFSAFLKGGVLVLTTFITLLLLLFFVFHVDQKHIMIATVAVYSVFASPFVFFSIFYIVKNLSFSRALSQSFRYGLSHLPFITICSGTLLILSFVSSSLLPNRILFFIVSLFQYCINLIFSVAAYFYYLHHDK